MKVKDLIEKLKVMPMDYDVRIEYDKSLKEMEEMSAEDFLVNFWIDSVELHKHGSSGYEEFGEVVIRGTE
jgi:hypothetical protein